MFLILMQMFYETVGGAAEDLINRFNILSCSSCSGSNQLVVNINSQLLFPAQTMKQLPRQRPLPSYSATVGPENSGALDFRVSSYFYYFVSIFSEFRSEDVCFLNRQK